MADQGDLWSSNAINFVAEQGQRATGMKLAELWLIDNTKPLELVNYD